MTDSIIVLVVEDETLVRVDMVDLLRDLDFLVFDAADAEQAIAVLDAHPDIQVMFTDVDMPGSMDGLKLASVVRNRWPPISIIVTSGHREVKIADMPLGSRFISKPYNPLLVATTARELAAS